MEQETGDVYVSDPGNNRVERFGPEGEFLLAFGWGVADGESEELQTCISTCFKGLRGPGAGQFNENEGIAVDNDPLSFSHGDVYVVDTGNARMQKFGANGEFLAMFGDEVNASTKGNICPASEAPFCQAAVEGAGPGQFEGLSSRAVAVDSTGVVYVGDRNRVQRFSGEGVQEGEVLFLGVGRVRSLALDAAKDIYLWGGLQEGVHKYDPSGSTELGAPRDPAGFTEGLAIAIGPGDELFVNDEQPPSFHVLGFDPEGKQLASFDSVEQSQSGFLGIAYSEHTEALYVLNQGVVRIVTPPPPGPFVLLGSEASAEVEPTTAKLEAMVNPEGGEATKCHFEYGATTAYGESSTDEELGGGAFEDQPVSALIGALSPNTTYHFRTVCENVAKEITEAPDASFTTLPAVSIDSISVSQVNATSARLEAELNPHGLPSEYRFEYGTSTAYGKSVPIPDGSAGSGTSDTIVSNLIQELLPSTTYHYRVIAHNALGSVAGPDRSFITQGPGSLLADGRTWEMVSPANKHGSPLEPLTAGGGLIQSTARGGAFAYIAIGPVEGEPKGSRMPFDSQLLATRDPAKGWSTEDIATPHEEVSIAKAGFLSEYKLFSDDLSASIVEPDGATPLSPQTSERTPYRREANGEFVPLVTATNVPPGTKFGGEEVEHGIGQWLGGVEFRTATPDLSHVVLQSPQVLAAGFKAGFEPEGSKSLYELADGRLTLVSALPSGEPTAEAGLNAGVGFHSLNMRGAISSDGSRVVFEAGEGNEKHVYLRDTSRGETVQLDAKQPGAAGGEGEPQFQAASSDGGEALFSDAVQLTPDASAKPGQPDMYMCEIGISAGHLSCALSDLSVDPNAGEVADAVGGVSAIDSAAEHVYFVASGVLTNAPNAQGEHAIPGSCGSEGGAATCNMYEYDTSTRQIKLVAVLSGGDNPDWVGVQHNLGNLTSRSSPDGRYFTFMSQRSLTGYDNRDVHSGQPDEEVYQFDAVSGKLICVSCNPTGVRPAGVFDKEVFPPMFVDHPGTWFGQWLAATIPGWTKQKLDVALYQSRYLSNSGREFFNSSDVLVPQDTNNTMDVYEFEPAGVGDCSSASKIYSVASGGCVSLISSGSSQEESAFLDASESGDEAFFLTNARLSGSDVDTAFDVYDAHVCSSSSPCPPPPPAPAPACEGDSCQNPSSPPNDPTPSSLTYNGPENPPPPPAPAPPKHKVRQTKAQLLAQALKACRKKHRRHERVTCERRAHKRYAPKRSVNKAKGGKATRKGRGSR